MTAIAALLKATPDEINTNCVVSGWVRTKRDSKAGFSFLAINDGSSFDSIQVVADQSLPNYQSEVLDLSTGCAVTVNGRLVASQGKGQSVEVQASEIEVLGTIEDPETYPIAKKRHSFEYLRTVAHLRPRTNTFGAVTRMRTTLAQTIHNYFFSHDFQWINTPLITGSDCEGAGELFRVSTLDLINQDAVQSYDDDFFGQETFLTVSGQLNVEAYCLAMTKVYTFGPTFRAENSNTSRHLAEFWMVEPEIAFANLDDNADLAEDLLRHVTQHVLDHCEQDLAFFNDRIDSEVISRLEQVANSPFERMEYSEAINILEQSGQTFDFPVSWGRDLQSEHERYLAEQHLSLIHI